MSGKVIKNPLVDTSDGPGEPRGASNRQVHASPPRSTDSENVLNPDKHRDRPLYSPAHEGDGDKMQVTEAISETGLYANDLEDNVPPENVRAFFAACRP